MPDVFKLIEAKLGEELLREFLPVVREYVIKYTVVVIAITLLLVWLLWVRNCHACRLRSGAGYYYRSRDGSDSDRGASRRRDDKGRRD